MKNEEFVVKQLKDTIAKIQGAMYFVDNNQPRLAWNKLLGINQKLVYIIKQIETEKAEQVEKEKGELNEGNKDSGVS